MAILRREPTQCSAEFVREAVAQAYSASNGDLQELANERRPEQRCAQRPDFHYLIPEINQTIPRAIPAAQFHRQYQLCLQALEVTIYGYCIQRQFGWERKQETAFSLRRPPIWRRMLRPAPLLAFTVSADQENVSINVNAADRPGYKNRKNHILRLNQELQEQLIRINQEQIAKRSLNTRISSWFKRFFSKKNHICPKSAPRQKPTRNRKPAALI